MRTKNSDQDKYALRPQYDFSQLKSRGKGQYAKRYREGTNLVLFEPDVAVVFPDDASVNEALRTSIRVCQGHAR